MKREIFDQIIIKLLSNKYKDKEINENLITEIWKEVSGVCEKVNEYLKDKTSLLEELQIRKGLKNK
jgi:hypothetical protein